MEKIDIWKATALVGDSACSTSMITGNHESASFYSTINGFLSKGPFLPSFRKVGLNPTYHEVSRHDFCIKIGWWFVINTGDIPRGGNKNLICQMDWRPENGWFLVQMMSCWDSLKPFFVNILHIAVARGCLLIEVWRVRSGQNGGCSCCFVVVVGDGWHSN